MSGEKLEAEFTNPGFIAMNAASGARSPLLGHADVSPTAGAYFMTDFLAHLQTQLNNNVQGYPTSADAMRVLVGSGVYTTGAGFLCNETSGNLVAVYGAPASLTAQGTPVYGAAGPRAGIDKAIGFDADADYFDAAGTSDFDVNGTSDLIVAWVGKFTANPGAVTEYMFAKGDIGAGAHWTIRYGSDGLLHFLLTSASGNKESTVTPPIGEWYVGFAVIDRGAGNCRIGVRTLAGVTTLGGSTALFAGETLSNANNFDFGNRSASDAAINQLFSAFYIATGTSCASGMAAGISTALTNFANAVNSSWSVTLSSTTGKVTFTSSYLPAYVVFNPTLQAFLGFDRDFDYPQTAAQMAAALGYGDWTSGAGYLLNESSGNPAAVFGSPATLTAAGSPTYAGIGARGGADKAITLPTSADRFSGGTSFDVGASDDLIVVWVGRIAPSTQARFFSKNGGGGYWYIDTTAGGNYEFQMHDGVDTVTASVAAPAVAAWHVGIIVLDRSTSKMRVAMQPLDGQAAAVSSEANAAAIGSTGTGATFFVGTTNNGNQSLSAFYIVKGSGVATGLSANLATALSNFATAMKSMTGVGAASGVYFPNTALMSDSDPKQAPIGDAKAHAITPGGRVYSMHDAGSEFFRARNVRFERVQKQYVWELDAATPGNTYETFYLETQLAHHDWFEVGSRVRVYWDNAGVLTELGSGVVDAWYMPTCVTLDELVLPERTWAGLVQVRLGDLFTDG